MENCICTLDVRGCLGFRVLRVLGWLLLDRTVLLVAFLWGGSVLGLD